MIFSFKVFKRLKKIEKIFLLQKYLRIQDQQILFEIKKIFTKIITIF